MKDGNQLHSFLFLITIFRFLFATEYPEQVFYAFLKEISNSMSMHNSINLIFHMRIRRVNFLKSRKDLKLTNLVVRAYANVFSEVLLKCT